MRHFSTKRDGASHPSQPKRTMRPAFFDNDEDGDEIEDQPDAPKLKSISKQDDGREADQEQEEEEKEEEEDDYMTMTFAETPTKPETSLQRRQRLQKEGLRRGMVPSKAQLAEQERERREAGLSRSLFSAAGAGAGTVADDGILLGEKIAAERRRKAQEQQQQQKEQDRDAAAVAAAKKSKSKGLAMMAKMGFTPGSALGQARGEEGDDGRVVEPLRIQVREDRGGIGLGDERKRKLREALLPEDEEGDDEGKEKKTKVVDEGDYRERMAKERDVARKERLILAAQKIAERMDEDKRAEEEQEKGTANLRPLKAIPVLYRGLVRHREEVERDRRARHDLEQSSGFALEAKLPRYAEDDDDEDLDAYDKMALGKEEEGLLLLPDAGPDSGGVGGDEKKKPVYMPADDLDEEDEELNAFNALEVNDKLAQLVEYLRERFRYCFWCKFAYPDDAMDGCPGVTEEDHD